MGQITATRNLVATKVVRLAGQWATTYPFEGHKLKLRMCHTSAVVQNISDPIKKYVYGIRIANISLSNEHLMMWQMLFDT